MSSAFFWTTVRDLALLLGLLVHAPLVEDLVAVGRAALAPRRLRVDALVDQLELEERGLADEGLGALGILHARELDEDAIVALLLDGRLGHAELVDAVADGLEPCRDGQLALGVVTSRVGAWRGRARPAAWSASFGLEGRQLVGRRSGAVPGLSGGELDHELGGAPALDAA